MKIIRFLLARYYYKGPWQIREWYNAAASISYKSWKDHNLIICYDDNGKYIDCPSIGGEVIYSIKGIKYIYEIIGFKNDNPNSDWLFSTDYINPIIQFVRKA